MDSIERALASGRSTILFGPLGRRPSLLQFYLQSIPDLELEPFFRYRSRLLRVWIEPPFGASVFADPWTLVLTSHLDLRWDPISVRVEDLHVVPLRRPLTRTSLDLSRTSSTHEAFLQLCDFLDRSAGEIRCPEDLRRRLCRALPRSRSPYASRLLELLG